VNEICWLSDTSSARTTGVSGVEYLKMPCKECGESAKEKHGGVCVDLSYDEDGMARYTCLDCTIDILEDSVGMN
jgi:hypothetical protein